MSEEGDSESSSNPDAGAAERGLTPEEAFALLGESTRLAIVRAVWEGPEPVSFSEIRERVGGGDTGRINYHLGKLRGHFVRRVEGGGYELGQAGTEVVRAVLAGSLNEAPVREPVAFGATCPDCDGDLLVGYDGHGTVSCAECGTVWMHDEFPPAGLAGRDPPGLARTLDRWTRHRSLLAFDGVCPNCASGTELTVDADFVAERACEHCKHVSRAPLWALVTGHPEVAGVLREHGVDAHARPFWELADIETGVDRAGEGFVVRFVVGDAALRVDLDADLWVVDVGRG